MKLKTTLLIEIFFGALFLCFAFWARNAGDLYDYQDTVRTDHLPQVDAIVCLAGGRGRIAAAGDLWFRYYQAGQVRSGTKTPTLFLSGVGAQTSRSMVLKQLGKESSEVISADNLVFENESVNTDENARLAVRFARDGHWRKILLLTSTYHMKRAQFIFEKTFSKERIPITIETLSVKQEPFTREKWQTQFNGIRVTLLEYLKWIYYKSII